MYAGGNSSVVYRADAQDLTKFYPWYDFKSGRPAGDFVILGKKMYIAWDNDFRETFLYEVSLDDNNNYVSHINIGKIKSSTFGLAQQNGKIFGTTPNFIYEINLKPFNTDKIIINNNFSEWWGSAGLNEAVDLNYTLHKTKTEAENNKNEILTSYVYTQSQTIYLRVENKNNHEFYVFPIKLNLTFIPENKLKKNYLYCGNPIFLDTELDLQKYDIQWFKNNKLIGNQSKIEVNEVGEYSVKIIDKNALCSVSYSTRIEENLVDKNSQIINLCKVENYTLSASEGSIFKWNNGEETQSITVNSFEKYEVLAKNTLQDCGKIFEFDIQKIVNKPKVKKITICDSQIIELNGEDGYISYIWNDGFEGKNRKVSNINTYILNQYDIDGCNVPIEYIIQNPVYELKTIQINQDKVTLLINSNLNLLYSIDNQITWNKSNTFSNLENGEYIIHIKTEDGCYLNSYKFIIFKDLSNIITPNSDGINDTWNLNKRFSKDLIESLKIYDRYGKLIWEDVNKTLNWNGKYLGNPLPSSTYWYFITLTDNSTKQGFIILKNY